MSIAATDPGRILCFGPFELDLRSGELRKNGSRVGLQDQPRQILSVLLERPGELVTREELRQRLWPADTFVDFEHGLNAAVKRLRDALGDSADTPRFIETVPRRGYRFIDSVQRPSETAQSPAAVAWSSLRPWRAAITLGLGALLLGMVMYATNALFRRRPPTIDRNLTRLTYDDGAQLQPTWSPDGKYLAYASERAGNLDVWVRSVAGGDAVQITKDAAADWQPDWSPDGNSIVFRSERDGGGLFVLPVLGGLERRLTTFGYDPRWSPDGSQVLFSGSPWAWFQARYYTIALDGSPPREVQPDFFKGFNEVRTWACWHPDGRRISVWGGRERGFGVGLWTLTLSGGAPQESDLGPEVERRIKDGTLWPAGSLSWAPAGDALYFLSSRRGMQNVWRTKVDADTLRWIGAPERLTSPPGFDTAFQLSRDGTG